MNIQTEYWPKPIPERKFDWDAWDEDLGEDSPVGHGLTEQEAITHLKIQLES